MLNDQNGYVVIARSTITDGDITVQASNITRKLEAAVECVRRMQSGEAGAIARLIYREPEVAVVVPLGRYRQLEEEAGRSANGKQETKDLPDVAGVVVVEDSTHYTCYAFDAFGNRIPEADYKTEDAVDAGVAANSMVKTTLAPGVICVVDIETEEKRKREEAYASTDNGKG